MFDFSFRLAAIAFNSRSQKVRSRTMCGVVQRFYAVLHCGIMFHEVIFENKVRVLSCLNNGYTDNLDLALQIQLEIAVRCGLQNYGNIFGVLLGPASIR